MSSLKCAKNIDPEKINWGAPAPDWLRYAETYLAGLNWPLIKAGKLNFVTHIPHDKSLFDRLNSLNVKPIPYIQIYHLQNYAPQFGIDLRRHMDWIAVDKNGDKQRTHFWQSADMKNWYRSCFFVEEYIDAIVAYVKKLMRQGAYGVFLDCVEGGRIFECYGEKHGVHKHIKGDLVKVYGTAIERISAAIKEINPDGAFLGNANPLSGNLAESWCKYFDAFMLESYICTSVSKERWFDWHNVWNKIGKKFAPAIRAGKQLQALSYLGNTKYEVKEDAYFCYATARLAGFVWCGGGKLEEILSLYSIRLGRPRTEERETNEIHYRVFEDGLVAVNPTADPRALILNQQFFNLSVMPQEQSDAVARPLRGRAFLPTIPSRRSATATFHEGGHLQLYDVFEDKQIIPGQNSGKITVPANSGRVYLFVPEVHEKNDLSEDDMVPERQATVGPKNMLRITTVPPFGDVCFRVDGIEYYTRGGCLVRGFRRGALFGNIEIYFEKPGWHEVEVVDRIFPATVYRAGNAGWKRPDPARAGLVKHRTPAPLEEKSSSLVWMGLKGEHPRLKLEEEKQCRFLNWQGVGSGASGKVKIMVKGKAELVAVFNETSSARNVF